MEAKALTTQDLATTQQAVAVVTDAGAEGHEATFDQLGVAESICMALATAGITRTFPIQALTLPID